MRILLSNDDGYQAPGIAALYEAARAFGEVVVVAPDKNCSGASNSLTLQRPLAVKTAPNGFRYVDGTPTDCVHLAVTGLLDFRPDLIISGINDGENMGDDTLYSGTVGAAMEGFLLGIPSIAFSMSRKPPQHWETGALAATQLLQVLTKQPMTKPWLLNVNIPDLPAAQFRGFKTTFLGKRHAAEPTIPTTNPRGDTVWWVGAAGASAQKGEGTDFHAVENGFASVTPLMVDLTAHSEIAGVQSWLGNVVRA
jgi:5'-nucleotidase